MEKKKKKHTFRKIFYFFLIILITLILCSTSTKTLKVKEYKIINSKINENHNGLKIIHFSDLHYGDTIKLNDLKTIVKEINLFNPDIIIFTGDLINSAKEYSDEEIKNIINELNKLKPNIESYLIKGNHDYNELFEKIINKTNFTVLKNEQTLFYYKDSIPIQIIGLESSLSNKLNIDKAFENYNEELYTILLLHEPDIMLDMKYNVDLILAGHSHGGQLRIPFIGAIYTPEGAKVYYDEKYIINNAEMYISSGLGTSIIPIRFFNPPTINFYRLYNK